MNNYQEYIQEIEERKGQGLHPKPIDDADLLKAIVAQIKDVTNENRQDSLSFFIYNTLPGTTSAAVEKANFLKEIISFLDAVSLIVHFITGPYLAII